MTEYLDSWDDIEDDGWRPEDDTEDVLGRPVEDDGPEHYVHEVPGLTYLVVRRDGVTVGYSDDPDAAQAFADLLNEE